MLVCTCQGTSKIYIGFPTECYVLLSMLRLKFTCRNVDANLNGKQTLSKLNAIIKNIVLSKYQSNCKKMNLNDNFSSQSISASLN